jgi:hypothetical protein
VDYPYIRSRANDSEVPVSCLVCVVYMEVTSFVFAFFPYFFLVITQCADFYLGSSFFSVINVFGGDGFLHFVTYAANQGDPTVQNSS